MRTCDINWTKLVNLAKMGCNYLGVEPLRKAWGNIVRVAYKMVRAFTRGPSGVQNKATTEPLVLPFGHKSRAKTDNFGRGFTRLIYDLRTFQRNNERKKSSVVACTSRDETSRVI